MSTSAFSLEPITVQATEYKAQFKIEGMIEGNSWEEQHISFGGYFGSYGPNVFAAAPEMFEALTLAAQSAGFQYMTSETRAKIDAALEKAWQPLPASSTTGEAA